MPTLFNAYGDFADLPETEMTTENLSSIIGTMILENCTAEEIEDFMNNPAEVQAAQMGNILTERTIVRFDKKAKLSRSYATALFQVAKEKKDRMFKKLLTVWKMERFLEGHLHKKYGNEAMRRAKKAQQAAHKSPVKLAQKAAERVKNSLNVQK